MKVVVGGWYGAANLGDEMILAAFVAWIREAGASATVISVNPAFTHKVHDVEAVGYNDLPSIVEALADAQLMLLGGGGLFQDYDAFDRASLARFPAGNVSQFAQFAFLASELGVPTAVLAQGVGPLRGDDARAITAQVFREALVCSVRDDESAALLRSIGVVREVAAAPDPAWTLPVTPLSPGARFDALAGRRVIALVVRDWPFDRAWESAFIAAFRDAVPDGWACLWLDFSRVPDARIEAPLYHEIAPRLVAELPGLTHVVWEGLELGEAAGLLAGSDAVVAMRLHGALLGHRCSVPVVAIEYDDKVRVLGDALGVPANQRMGLDQVAQRLPVAMKVVTGGTAYRVAPATVARLADEAALHRDLLRHALAMPRGPTGEGHSLVAGWLATHDERSRRRILAAMRRDNAP